jgi:hypothetical protein
LKETDVKEDLSHEEGRFQEDVNLALTLDQLVMYVKQLCEAKYSEVLFLGRDSVAVFTPSYDASSVLPTTSSFPFLSFPLTIVQPEHRKQGE